MRYLCAPAFEVYEEQLLPTRFGKRYAPRAEVTLRDSALLEPLRLDEVELDGERLLIEPDTASWVFLTRREAQWVRALAGGRSFAWLAERWPADALGAAEHFVADLFRRGLLRIDGDRAVDDSVFHDSSNYSEGQLVELLLTEKCNLACGYCLAGAGQHMPQMTPEVARRSIDLAFAMHEAESLSFEFSGGEPFIRFPLMRELADYIRGHPGRRGREVSLIVQSNGTLLDEERVQWLRDNEVQIGISLDGDPASHNRSRPQVNGGESFSKLLRGVDLLQRGGVPFGVLVVLNRSNVGSVENLLDFLLENGLDRIKLNAVAHIGNARRAWGDVGLNQEEVIDYFERFARRLVEMGVPLVEANLQDMLRHLVSKQRHSRCLRGHCGAGETFQTIASDGTIYPCGRGTQTPAFALGNVAEEHDSLSAPGRGNLIIQQIKERRPKTLEGCVTCSYRELCQAGCSAQAFVRYGTVRHRTPECAFFKTLYPFLMRWLCFDPRAIDFFHRSGYFGRGVELVEADYLPERSAA